MEMKKFRFRQTAARIGAGASTMAALLWTLWPDDFGSIEIEPLFVFATAFFFWFSTEIKWSEEVVYRGATPNDQRVAGQILSYHAGIFRVLLKEQDFHYRFRSDYFDEILHFCSACDRGEVFLQDQRLSEAFTNMLSSLSSFVNYLSLHSTPDTITNTFSKIIPDSVSTDWDIPQHYREAIEEANKLAGLAWEEFETFVGSVKKNIPEAADDPINHKFYYPKIG